MWPFDSIFAGHHETGHPHIAHLVLPASVGAPRNLDLETPELGDHVVGLLARRSLLEVLTDAGGNAHALGDGERTIVGAWAGDDVGDVQRVPFAEPYFGEGSIERVELHRGDPAKKKILLVGRSNRSIAELAGKFGDAS